jgi:hypothetical protein
MDKEYLWDLLQFAHQPMRPPRNGFVGENVFHAEWSRHVADTNAMDSPPNEKLADLLGAHPFQLTERSATVAASLVCWLGTNMGRCFLEEAAKLAKRHTCSQEAYLMAWAAQNARRSFCNHGRRALESCLISDAEPNLVPVLSADDYEVAEHLVMWLGSKDGQKFLKTCETEIKRQNHAESFKSHLVNNLKLSPSSLNQVLKMAAEYHPTPVPRS